MSYQSAQRPIIDGFEFASAGARQQGSLPVSGFPRLRDLLASDAGEVAYEVEGLRDAQGRPSLRLSVHGTLQLRCQRCLEPMVFEVREDEVLVLAASQAEIDADPPDASAPDRVLSDRALALRDVVEDELILAVPYAPRHAQCTTDAAGEASEKVSPFTGLRGLLRDRRPRRP